MSSVVCLFDFPVIFNTIRHCQPKQLGKSFRSCCRVCSGLSPPKSFKKKKKQSRFCSESLHFILLFCVFVLFFLSRNTLYDTQPCKVMQSPEFLSCCHWPSRELKCGDSVNGGLFTPNLPLTKSVRFAWQKAGVKHRSLGIIIIYVCMCFWSKLWTYSLDKPKCPKSLNHIQNWTEASSFITQYG